MTKRTKVRARRERERKRFQPRLKRILRAMSKDARIDAFYDAFYGADATRSVGMQMVQWAAIRAYCLLKRLPGAKTDPWLRMMESDTPPNGRKA